MQYCAGCGEESWCCWCPTSPASVPESVLVGIFGSEWQSYAYRTARKVVCNYGLGENSVSVLLYLYEQGIKPAAIVQADPGHEWEQGIQFRDEVMRPWLASIGWPDIVTVSRESEAEHNPRSAWKGTLGEDCLKVSAKGHAGLPSAAFGKKSCSQKFKTEPMHWYLQRQQWVQAEWEAGFRIFRLIGYDADESHRVDKYRHHVAGKVLDIFEKPEELRRYKPWYPLHDAGWTREDCIKRNFKAFGRNPGKSACKFCPNNSLEDWERLRKQDPAGFEFALQMERAALPHINEASVGLMRCNRPGSRLLTVWNENKYASENVGSCDVSQSCDCAVDA